MNEQHQKPPTRPADPLSVISLAAAIAALVLTLFSVLPMMGMCLMPLAVISVSVSILTGIASLIRTTMKPELDGRMQALAGLGLSAVWGLAFFILVRIVMRH